jgi:hypothetical protein
MSWARHHPVPFTPVGCSKIARWRDVLERATLCRNAEPPRGKFGYEHEGGTQCISCRDYTGIPGPNKSSEYPRGGNPAERGAAGIKDRNRERANLEREDFAHAQIC